MLKGLEYDKPFFGKLIRRVKVDKFAEDQSRYFLYRVLRRRASGWVRM
jgi:hypothetical protein